MGSRSRTSAIALVVAAALVVAGCSSDAEPDATSGDTSSVDSSDATEGSEGSASQNDAAEGAASESSAPSVAGVEIAATSAVDAPWTATVVDDLAWVPHLGGVTAVDADLEPIHQIDLAGHPETALEVDGRLWFANIADPTLTVLDPAEPTAFVQIPVGNQGFTPVEAQGSIWVPNRADGTVSRVDPATLEVVDTVVGLEGLGTLRAVDDEVYAVIGGDTWQVSAPDGPVVVDPVPSAPLEAFGATWRAEGSTIVVTGGPVESVAIGSPVSAVLATDERLLVVAGSGLLVIDPATGDIVDGLDADIAQPLVTPTGLWFVEGDAGDATTIVHVEIASLARHEVSVPGVPDDFALLGDTLVVSLKNEGSEVLALRTIPA